jgi:hypothetical protein
MDMEKFRGIQPRECLNQAWTKKDKETRAPNILGMIEQFNKVTSWYLFVRRTTTPRQPFPTMPIQRQSL